MAKCSVRYFDMSRVAEVPIDIPAGVEVTVKPDSLSVKGNKGTLDMKVHKTVGVVQEGAQLRVSLNDSSDKLGAKMSGTTRALIANMVHGVTVGFEKKLLLTGIGYRVQAKGKVLDFMLGFSHPVNYVLPDDIEGETPSQTEIILRGIDKQKVGQIAAEIRSFRPIEPYKGKGISYEGEVVVRKETKKK